MHGKVFVQRDTFAHKFIFTPEKKKKKLYAVYLKNKEKQKIN